MHIFMHCWALVITVDHSVNHTVRVGRFVKPGPTSCNWLRCSHGGEGRTAIGCAHPVDFGSERQMVGCEVSLRDVQCKAAVPYRPSLIAANILLKQSKIYTPYYVISKRVESPDQKIYRMLSKTNIQSQSFWHGRPLWVAVSWGEYTLNSARSGRSIRCDVGSAKQALPVCDQQVDELGEKIWRDPLSNQWLSGKLKIGKLSALIHLDTWWIYIYIYIRYLLI